MITVDIQLHAFSVALICARLLPIALLCPLLGGATSPMHVKLSVVLALAGFAHVAGGISAPATTDTFEYAGAAARELLFGTTLGMLAALPFDVARMGGRFVDLFRGSSAEAALPMAGSREAASGDVLHQLLVAMSVTVAMPILISSIFKSFLLVRIGAFIPSEIVAMQIVALVSTAFATALAIGAPLAGLSMAIDVGIGLASRAASGVNLQDLGSPLRILGGGAVLWLGVGIMAERTLNFATDTWSSFAAVSVLP